MNNDISEVFSGQWITHPAHKDWQPVDVFSRHLERKEIKIERKDQDLHILFRREFELKDFKECLLNISADDYYKLYINGVFVTQGPAPGYPWRYFYNALDVTSFLKPGKNLIAVHTYYQGVINRVWVSGDQRTGLCMELFADGKSVLASDGSFRCTYHTGYADGELTGYSTQFLERYDARSSEEGFELPDYDDSVWLMAAERKYVDYTMVRQLTEQLTLERIKPVSVERSGNRIKIDFDAINAGYLEYAATGPAGAEIEMLFAQELNEDNTLRWQLRASCHYNGKFTLSGRKYDLLKEFDYKAFRYAELILPEGVEVDIDSIVFIARHYPFELKASCNAADEKSLAVWKLCTDSLHYGVQETVLDCMEREKGYYMGDGNYTQFAHALLTGDFTAMEKFFDDFLASAVIDRGLMACGNCSLMQEIGESPLMFIVQAWSYLACTGNKEFIRARYSRFADILDYFCESYADSDGLLHKMDKWCVIEWPKEYRDGYDVDLTEGQVCVVKHNAINAYYIGAVKAMNRIAEYLELEPYKDVKPLEESFRKAFYLEDEKLFCDSVESKHISTMGNLFAAFFGLCPDKASKQAVVELIRRKRFSGSNLAATFPMMMFLKVQGENELFQSLLHDEGAWLRTIREDGKRTFEGWGRDSKWNTSLLHLFMASGVLYLMDWNGENILEFSRD